MARLGGEYYDPGDGGALPVQHARLVFLDRVRCVVPAVLETLRDDVLPVYREAHAAAPDRNEWWDPGNAREWGRPAFLPSVEAAVCAWGVRWNLTDAWVQDDALATLYEWTTAPTRLARMEWHADHWSNVQPEPPEGIRIEWDPLMETWPAFSARVDAAMQDLRARAAAWAAEHGLRPSPEKNAPRRTDDAGLHFEWLARYQCDGWTHERIARHYGRAYDEANRTAPAVASAIRDTASLIGLTTLR